MTRAALLLSALLLIILARWGRGVPRAAAAGEGATVIDSQSGLRLNAVGSYGQVKLLLPRQPASDRGIEVDCPEHVTAQRAQAEVEHLYLRVNDRSPVRTTPWKRDGRSLLYSMDLPYGTQMQARVTLECDGIRIRYDFTNAGNTAFEMWQAPTCVKLTEGSRFHDVRLERTYVHRASGSELLASEVPARLTLPEERWLPCRVLDPYRWPVAPQRVERREEGLTWYNISRPVDVPAIATISSDGEWVAATCTSSEIGNVWSNPALTCHHTDPVAQLLSHGRAAIEVRTFVVQGTLDLALRRVEQYRAHPGG